MPKIPVSSIGPWAHASDESGQRSGSTYQGLSVVISIRKFFKESFSWRVVATGIMFHGGYAITYAAAQDAADSYLAEHFELPVDELAQAKKRIAELEAQLARPLTTRRTYFHPGQPVHIKGASKAATIPITCIRLYAGDTVYSLANGMSFKAHELEPA